MINWWLILIAVLLSLLVLFLSIYFVVIFISDADAGMAYVPKIVCVLGMMLACLTVLLLPFDVAARTDPTSFSKFSTKINTETLWQAMLWIDAGFVLVIIPLATFYYEAMDPDKPDFVDQLAPAVGYTLAINAVFFILCGVLWYFKGYANLPYLSYTGLAQFKGPLDTSLQYLDFTSAQTLNLRVSFFVYMIALLCFFGWILFIFYGGAGLVAFPYDFILDFKYRPKPMKKQEFDQELLAIATRAKQMQDAGKKLDKDQRANNNNSVRNRINLFRSEVLLMEERLDKAIVSYQEQGGSPFVIFGKLLLGIIGIALTVMWVLHIVINNIVKANPLLNTLFITLDNAFALLGVIAYSIFAFYLLWASIKGCIKIGMRIVFFTIHPMKLGDTLLNALLFNVGLILITAVTVVQFCSQSFSTYAVNTSVDMLIGTYVRRLVGIGTILFYFQYALLVMIGLSVLWILLCPRKKPKKKNKDELKM